LVKNKIPELLAPAGNQEAIFAAVSAGADAVYFGLKEFNARRNADNIDHVGAMTAYCHQNNVKVYITFNILIKDDEMPLVKETLKEIAKLNIDGLIVQDLGLIYFLQKYYPNIPLQTSTQGSVFGIEGVHFYESLGFKRVVLPREMSLKEVTFIRNHTAIELKVFCHGALCYAYSGQCLMSSVIGGRSGNRGLCAQPCRKYYELYDEEQHKIKSGYLLSMKDLNTRKNIDAMIDAGIHSLKIEGRMKTPEYVYAVTKAYRDAIDHHTPSISEEALKQVFNRTFTSGRLNEDLDRLNTQVSKNQGIEIGKVGLSRHNKLTLQLKPEITLQVGDGLAFGEKAEVGCKVDVIFNQQGNRIAQSKQGETVEIPSILSIPNHTSVYRNFDAALMKNIQDNIKEGALPKKALDFKIEISEAQPVKISLSYEQQRVTFESRIMPEKAQHKPLDEEIVKTQISKLGNTEYYAEKVEVNLDQGLFLTRKQLNDLRKLAIVELEAYLQSVDQNPKEEKLSEKTKSKQPYISLEINPTKAIKEVIAFDVDEYVLMAEHRDDLKSIEAIANQLKHQGKHVLLTFPRKTDSFQIQWIKDTLSQIKQMPIDGVLVKNIDTLFIFKDTGLWIETDQWLNVFNASATAFLKAQNVASVVFSSELSEQDLYAASKQAQTLCTFNVYGREEVMLSEQCLLDCELKNCEHCQKMKGWYTLEDQHGAHFPFYRDDDGLTHIFNADTWYIDRIEQPYIDKWRLHFVDESVAEMKKVIAHYQSIRLGQLTDKLSGRRFTQSNYKKGVQ